MGHAVFPFLFSLVLRGKPKEVSAGRLYAYQVRVHLPALARVELRLDSRNPVLSLIASRRWKWPCVVGVVQSTLQLLRRI